MKNLFVLITVSLALESIAMAGPHSLAEAYHSDGFRRIFSTWSLVENLNGECPKTIKVEADTNYSGNLLSVKFLKPSGVKLDEFSNVNSGSSLVIGGYQNNLLYVSEYPTLNQEIITAIEFSRSGFSTSMLGISTRLNTTFMFQVGPQSTLEWSHYSTSYSAFGTISSISYNCKYSN